MAISIDNVTDFAIIAAVGIGGMAAYKYIVSPALKELGEQKLDKIYGSEQFVGAVHKAVATSPAFVEVKTDIGALAASVQSLVNTINATGAAAITAASGKKPATNP